MFHGDDAVSSAETISGHDPTVGQYQYDPANGSHDTYTYDADTLTGISEPDGVSLTEGYDSQGQNDGYSASDGTNTWSESETLNDQGQPSEITDTDPSGTYTRDLDYDSGSGLLTSESGGVLGGVKTSYAYNDDQTLASTTLGTDDAAYSEEGYTYDAQGRLSTLDANGTTFTYGYDDSTGLLHTVTSSTGVTTTYGYDTATENLTSITVTNASDTTLYSVSYEYNNDNQITSAAVTSTDAGGTTTTTDWAYTYDNMSQLQSAIASVGGTPVSGQDYTYTYDAAGNETGQGTVNDMNQLAADTYDGRGDVTDDGKSSYAYNPLGQLISVTPDSPTSGSQEVTYDYDDQGRMTIRNAYSWDSGTDSWSGTATTTKFAYDGTSLIGEFNVTFDGSTEVDTPVQTYTWGANGLQTIQIWNSGGTSVVKTLIPVADAGGNIVMLVNAADGSINATYTYDPYGNLIGSSGNVADSPFQFGGQNGTYTDAATGLVLTGARWYSPAQGRFLTEDPSGQDGGLNRYEYADNDPVNEIDPTGLYGESGHFYTTFLVAMATGKYSVQQAQDLAYYSQLPDQYADYDAEPAALKRAEPYFPPTDPGAIWATLANPELQKLQNAVFADADWGVDVQSLLHSLNGQLASKNRAALEQLLRGRTIKSIWELGMIIHAWGDSYAHTTPTGRAYIGPLGHTDVYLPDFAKYHDIGQHIDAVGYNPKLYQLYIHDLYSVLGGDPTTESANPIMISLIAASNAAAANVDLKKEASTWRALAITNGYTSWYAPENGGLNPSYATPTRSQVFSMMQTIGAAEGITPKTTPASLGQLSSPPVQKMQVPPAPPVPAGKPSFIKKLFRYPILTVPD